jgi:hypothetical protein
MRVAFLLFEGVRDDEGLLVELAFTLASKSFISVIRGGERGLREAPVLRFVGVLASKGSAASIFSVAS